MDNKLISKFFDTKEEAEEYRVELVFYRESVYRERNDLKKKELLEKIK